MEYRSVTRYRKFSTLLLMPMKINRLAFILLLLTLIGSWICLMILFYSNQNLMLVNRDMTEKQRLMLRKTQEKVDEQGGKIDKQGKSIEKQGSELNKQEGQIEDNKSMIKEHILPRLDHHPGEK